MEKVIDIEDRIPSMRKKRKRKANKKFLLLVFVFLLVLLTLLYFQSSLSDVQTISINETALNSSETYEEQSGIAVGSSLWGFRTAAAEKKLESITGVKEAAVKREFLNDVVIRITEWKPIAYIENDSDYDLLLENGSRIPLKNQEILSHAPILSKFKEEQPVKQMIAQLQEMEGSVFELISELHYKGEDRIAVFMNDGYEVHATITGFADKMTFYPEIIAQLPKEEKGVLDIELGAYFKKYSDYYREPEAENDETVKGMPLDPGEEKEGASEEKAESN